MHTSPKGTHSGKLLTSFVLHIEQPTKELVNKTIPEAGESAFLFYLQHNETPSSIEEQLEAMQLVFLEQQRKSAIDRIYLEANSIEKETLCYFENSERGKFQTGENALFSCDHVFVDLGDSTVETMNENETNVFRSDISWDSFLESPLLIFDDRYNGPGFWKFVEELIRKHTCSFDYGALKVQLQGLAVPVVEESIDAGYTYDVFYSDANRSSSDTEHETRNATKYTVRNTESLKDVLSKSEVYTTSIEKDVGRSHLVLHIRFSGEGREKQNICIVRLREVDDDEDFRHFLLSAEVLRLLVEELALASAEGATAEDTIVFQENGIKEAFECTRLTHIISKVIRKSYASCKAEDKPLFHWLVNMPAGELIELPRSQEKMICVQLKSSTPLSEAVGIAVRLQDVNITRSEISENGKGYVGSARGGAIEENDNTENMKEDYIDDSSLSRRRRKLRVKRLYDTLSSRSQEESRSNSETCVVKDGTGNNLTEVREKNSRHSDIEKVNNGSKPETLSVPLVASVSTAGSTAGSYAESWNTVDLGGSAARRRYRLKRKPKRKVATPVFFDAPEEESGQIALVEGDFDSTSLRGSSAARTRSNSMVSGRSHSIRSNSATHINS